MPRATLESALRILMRRRLSHTPTTRGTRAAIHATIAALRLATE
jgi:hypothetical protein